MPVLNIYTVGSPTINKHYPSPKAISNYKPNTSAEVTRLILVSSRNSLDSFKVCFSNYRNHQITPKYFTI